MKRSIYIGLGTGIVAVVVFAAIIWYVSPDGFLAMERRAIILNRYGTALELYAEKGETVPDSLAPIVERYNASEAGKEEPIPLDYPEPSYRPAAHLRNGPYLVFIDVPKHLKDRTYLLFYAYPDGRVDGFETASKEDLPWLIKRDDRRRAVGMQKPASTQPQTQKE